MNLNKFKEGGGFRDIQNKYPLIKVLLDQFQNIFLDPEKTVNLFIRVLDALVTNLGFENYALALQKPLNDLNQILVFLVNFIRQKYISAVIDILNLIPHISPFLGTLDSVTMQNLNQIEFDSDIGKQFEVIFEIIKNVKIVLTLIENKLNIQKNLPFILNCPIIYKNINYLLDIDPNINNKLNCKIEYNHNDKSISCIINYFNYNDNHHLRNSFENFLSFEMSPILNQNDFNLDIDDKNEKTPHISNYIFSQWQILKSEIKQKLIIIINHQKHDIDNQINSETKIFISGNGLNGCLAILLTLDITIQEIFCEIGINKPNFFVITLGCPNFVDINFQKSFLKQKNIVLYHFIYPLDLFSYLKFKINYVPLALPTILCSAKLVSQFYNDFYQLNLSFENLNIQYNELFNKYNLLSDKFKKTLNFKIIYNSPLENLIHFNSKINYKELIMLLKNKYFKHSISENNNNKYLNNNFYNTNIH